MKKVRVTDFDPDAKVPELGSPLDDMPAIQRPSKSPTVRPQNAFKTQQMETKQPNEENEPINEVTNVRTNERSMERRKIRHTFDIYEDQLLSLKEIALDRQKTFGKRVLLGDLVQEALDTKITKERNKQ